MGSFGVQAGARGSCMRMPSAPRSVQAERTMSRTASRTEPSSSISLNSTRRARAGGVNSPAPFLQRVKSSCTVRSSPYVPSIFSMTMTGMISSAATEAPFLSFTASVIGRLSREAQEPDEQVGEVEIDGDGAVDGVVMRPFYAHGAVEVEDDVGREQPDADPIPHPHGA